MDPFAVKVIKSPYTVGYLPKNISSSYVLIIFAGIFACKVMDTNDTQLRDIENKIVIDDHANQWRGRQLTLYNYALTDSW